MTTERKKTMDVWTSELKTLLLVAVFLHAWSTAAGNRIRIRVVWLDIDSPCLVHTCKEAKFRFAITDDEVERSISWPLNTVAEDAEISFLNRNSLFNFTMDIIGIDLMYGFQRLCDSIFERQVTFQLDLHKGITLHGRCFNTTVVISYDDPVDGDHGGLNRTAASTNDSYVATLSTLSAAGTVPVWTLMAVAGMAALLMVIVNVLVCCCCCRKNEKPGSDESVKSSSSITRKRNYDRRHDCLERSYYTSAMLLGDGRQATPYT